MPFKLETCRDTAPLGDQCFLLPTLDTYLRNHRLSDKVKITISHAPVLEPTHISSYTENVAKRRNCSTSPNKFFLKDL